ncbi:hypothetical protein P8971_23680 [Serratia marcescens]|uniref:hypothetical protein n=1 Tax=Serratia marcescens TaxID=615 RepID=UPI003204C12A
MPHRNPHSVNLNQQALSLDLPSPVQPHSIEMHEFDGDTPIQSPGNERIDNGYLKARFQQAAQEEAGKADRFALYKHAPILLGSGIDIGLSAWVTAVAGGGALPLAIKSAIFGKDAINAVLDYLGRKNVAAGREPFPGGADAIKNTIYLMTARLGASPVQAASWAEHAANYINNAITVAPVVANRYAPANVAESTKFAMDLFSLLGKPALTTLGGMAEAQSAVHAKKESLYKASLAHLESEEAPVSSPGGSTLRRRPTASRRRSSLSL